MNRNYPDQNSQTAETESATASVEATEKLLDERLANLTARLESYQKQLADAELAVTKLGRIQFKANTLSESQQQQTAAALAVLQAAVDQQAQWQAERQLADQTLLIKTRAQARSELAVDLLPVLDGIESAIENGQLLLARRRANRKSHNGTSETQTKPQTEPHTSPQTPPATFGFWQRLSFAFGLKPWPVQLPAVQMVPVSETAPTETETGEEALAAWLAGLELVRERFLALLTVEGIQAIATDQSFDPRLHVAVEAIASAEFAPGSIIRTLRKGYRQGERVIRYAEVKVAKELK